MNKSSLTKKTWFRIEKKPTEYIDESVLYIWGVYLDQRRGKIKLEKEKVEKLAVFIERVFLLSYQDVWPNFIGNRKSLKSVHKRVTSWDSNLRKSIL